MTVLTNIVLVSLALTLVAAAILVFDHVYSERKRHQSARRRVRRTLRTMPYYGNGSLPPYDHASTATTDVDELRVAA